MHILHQSSKNDHAFLNITLFTDISHSQRVSFESYLEISTVKSRKRVVGVLPIAFSLMLNIWVLAPIDTDLS